MDKKAVFKELLNKFETEKMKLYCEDMIENIPDYIFTMPSSTSGKFHNATQCLPHGQIYHIIMFGAIMNYRLALKCNKEKYSDPIHRDAMRCVPIFHDAVKCGWNGSKFTVHDHPMLAGTWVRETKVEHDIDDDIKEMIARMCERHSGEWTSSKRSEVVLPEPETEMEMLVHECDILSSRSDIDMQPSDYLKSILGEVKIELPNLDEFKLSGGTFAGKTIAEVAKIRPSWLDWAKSEHPSDVVRNLVKQFLSSQEDEI